MTSMIPPGWHDAVTSVRARLDSMDSGRRLCLLAVACEHLIPFADHAEAQGLPVDAWVLRSAMDAVWDQASGDSPSVGIPVAVLDARIPTDGAGVGRSGNGAEQVAGLVRGLAIAREFEAAPSSAKALDGLVGVADSLSDFGDLPEEELAELDRVGAQLAAAPPAPTDVSSLRHGARSHGQELLERAMAMGLWGDRDADGSS